MDWKQIYETSNENAVLKSLGPFRILITDNSIEGINKGKEEIYKPLIEGETSIYGEVSIIKEGNE